MPSNPRNLDFSLPSRLEPGAMLIHSLCMILLFSRIVSFKCAFGRMDVGIYEQLGNGCFDKLGQAVIEDVQMDSSAIQVEDRDVWNDINNRIYLKPIKVISK